MGGRRPARLWIGGRGLLRVIVRKGGEGEGMEVPNWSQLRRTPISFLPSRRATMSFSKVRKISPFISFAK